MITDDERREVARRLRKAIGLTEFAEALGFNWTDDSDWAWKDVSNLVADLIEPPMQCPYYRSDRHYCSAYDDVVDRDALLALADELDGEEVGVDPTWIGYGPDVTLSVEVGNQYRDWLGNTRQGKGHETLDVRVERMSGELWLCHDGHVVEGTVKEIEAAMELAERLRDLGVKFGDGTITVPLPKSESEAEK